MGRASPSEEAASDILVVGAAPDQFQRLQTLLDAIGATLSLTTEDFVLVTDPAVILVESSGLAEPVDATVRSLLSANSEHRIVVLARSAASDKRSTYIEAGARDVLTQNCGPREFLARVWACLREMPSRNALIVGPLRIDISRRIVWVDDDVVHLTTAEFDTLALLTTSPLVTHQEISTKALNRAADQVETSAVRFHLANLRRKLRSAGCMIEAVRPRMVRLSSSRGVADSPESGPSSTVTYRATTDTDAKPSKRRARMRS
jgi:DNA-binding response OmpR family regulator